MSLIKLITNIFRDHKNNLEKALADPERDGKLAIEDARVELRSFETSLRDLAAKTIILERSKADAVEDIAKYHVIATKAAAQGNRDDAASALLEKKRAERTAASLTSEIAANHDAQENAKQHIQAMNDRITNAEDTAQRSSVRLSTAELRTALSDNTSALGTGLAALDGLETAANEAEAIAQATEEMAAQSPEARKKALEAKYSAGGGDFDAELDEMMAAAAK